MLTGSLLEKDWKGQPKKVDFFVLKGILEGLIASYGLTENITFVADKQRDGMHPGRTAAIFLGEKEIGFAGQIHPLAAKAYELDETYGFELNLQAVVEAEKESTVYEAIPKFPGMTRDIALLVDEAITNQQLVDLIYKKGGKYLVNVRLFDIYQGENIDRKSVV